MRTGTFKTDEACRHWAAEISKIAQLYERRWTRLSLNRIDADLAARLAAQQSLYDSACLRGTVAEIEAQGGGLCRGWLAAIRAMEEHQVPDDAYMFGSDPVSGMRVAIGHSKASAELVAELYGKDCVWISPDEVAVLLALTNDLTKEATGLAVAVKQHWPGAEVTRHNYVPANSVESANELFDYPKRRRGT